MRQEGIDIKLTQTNGIFDISIGSDGDLELCNSFETAVNLSLFSNKRADQSEQEVPELRGGWWGNECLDNFEIGSKVWLLSQSKNTQDTANKMRDYVLDSLNWLIEGNYLKDIEVETTILESDISVAITLIRQDSETEKYYYALWENFI